MSKEQESKAVFLSAELHGRIEERVKATGFGSVDEYVIFVLEEVLREEGEEEEQAFTKDEEEKAEGLGLPGLKCLWKSEFELTASLFVAAVITAIAFSSRPSSAGSAARSAHC